MWQKIKTWFANHIQDIAWGLLILSIVIILYFLISAIANHYWIWGGKLSISETGEVGDFVGGFVGTIINAAAFLFLYLTLKEQRETTNDQRNSFQKERLESKFFDLIKMHRENVAELKMRSVKIIEEGDDYAFKTFDEEGKAVFKDIFYQFVDCNNELKLFFKRLDRIYEIKYREKLEQNPLIGYDNQKLAIIAKVDICYSIVYYGVGAEGLITLRKIFDGKYKAKFITDLLQYISLKPANYDTILSKWSKLNRRGSRQTKIDISDGIHAWRKRKTELSLQALDTDNSIEELVNNYHNKYIKFYGGHQFRLGHYFRHLYQSVKFINNQVDLNFSDKYEYIKVLRAQLSNYEQAVIFLNSLSSLGHAWELEPQIKSGLEDQGRKNFELITKYNLIKNLPGDTMYGVPFKIFYPNVQFEGLHTKRDNSIYK